MIGTKRGLLIPQNKPIDIPITFTRLGVAYDGLFNPIPDGQPRFNWGSLGQGLMIEEGTTNLIPANLSQSFNSVWTSGTLNGTYTVSINSGGSLVLSGGATGTCASGGTLTFTVSNATVTFTPTGVPTHSQLENKTYPTSWHIGEGTRYPEICYLGPSNLINLTQGLIEVEFITSAALLNTTINYRTLLFLMNTDGNNEIALEHSAGGATAWVVLTKGTGSSSSQTKIGIGTKNTITRLTCAYDQSNLSIIQNGAESTPIANPNLPTDYSGYLTLGNRINLDRPGSCIIRKVHISNAKRTDRVSRNANGISTKDKNTSFYIDFTSGYNMVGKRYSHLKNPKAGVFPKPAVIFTFDNSWTSHYTQAMSYMHGKGLNPTVFINAGLLGATGLHNDGLTETQVNEMYEDGWLIANHTWDHQTLTDLSESDQELKITQNRDWLNQNGYSDGANLLAFPAGCANSDTVTAMQNAGVELARGWGKLGGEWNPIVRYLGNYGLNINGLCTYTCGYSGTNYITTSSDLTAIIDANMTNQLSTILVLHQVKDTLPENTSLTIATFQSMIDAVVAKGYRCLNVRQWINEWKNYPYGITG